MVVLRMRKPYRPFGGLKPSALLALMCIIAVCLKVQAQSRYITDTTYLKQKNEGDNLLRPFTNWYPDSATYNLHNYTERNTLGALGLATHLWRFKFRNEALGFRLYPLPYDENRIEERDMLYYRTKGPFASATGIAGSKEQQLFRFLFSQTFRNGVNVSLKFNRYTNKGFYLSQQAFVNNFYLNSNYETRNGRFGYYGFVMVNNLRNQENGGLKADSSFLKNITENKELMPVNLSTASRDTRLLSTQFNPYMRFSKPDSLGRKASFYLQGKSKFTYNTYKFKDAQSGKNTSLYQIYYLDTVATKDSTRHRQFYNEVLLSFKTRNKQIGLSAGYANEVNIVWQKNDSLIVNHLAKANATYTRNLLAPDSITNRQIQYTGFMELASVLSGANSGNIKWQMENTLNFSENHHQSRLFLNLLYETRSADYIYNRWYGNHQRWSNHYKPVAQLQAQLGFEKKNLQVSIFYQNITNTLYFDSLSAPKQFTASVTNFGAEGRYTLILFKHLGLSLAPVFQTSSKPSIYRMPLLSGKVNLFYTGNLFKNNLQLTVGTQLETYSTYELMRYNPVIHQFYLGNRKEIGYYPYTDIYLNARIRPVSFFVKLENALYGLAGNTFYFVPGYIQPDRAIRFGLTWIFFD